jgi:hypothetical protein
LSKPNEVGGDTVHRGESPIAIAGPQHSISEVRLNPSVQMRCTFDWDTQFESIISKLTATQIQIAFKRYIDPSHLVIVTAGDFH